MANVQILRAARARIADPIHWTTGHLARDEQGSCVTPNSPGAACWCAYGAIEAEGSCLWKPEGDALRAAAGRRFNTASVGYVNDMLGHVAVLAIYDDAIASAEASA